LIYGIITANLVKSLSSTYLVKGRITVLICVAVPRTVISTHRPPRRRKIIAANRLVRVKNPILCQRDSIAVTMTASVVIKLIVENDACPAAYVKTERHDPCRRGKDVVINFEAPHSAAALSFGAVHSQLVVIYGIMSEHEPSSTSAVHHADAWNPAAVKRAILDVDAFPLAVVFRVLPRHITPACGITVPSTVENLDGLVKTVVENAMIYYAPDIAFEHQEARSWLFASDMVNTNRVRTSSKIQRSRVIDLRILCLSMHSETRNPNRRSGRDIECP
jgi:hypothetical protein